MMNRQFQPVREVPNSTPEESTYHAYHKKRIQFALDMVDDIVCYRNFYSTVEVGPWTIAYNLTTNGLVIDSIGYLDPKMEPYINDHFEFDLNTLKDTGFAMLPQGYDVVIAAEVIEHLYLDLDLIFRFLNNLTKQGGVVVIQTPNAAALKKRMWMLQGRNPFDMVGADYRPGMAKHVREFTIKELTDCAERNGFIVKKVYCKNYFNYSHSWKARLYKAVCDLLPKTCRDGITLVIKKKWIL
jgi:hypothetical protein